LRDGGEKTGMRKQEKTVIIIACVDLLSIIIKFFLAAITGSLSILADSWHSIGDLTTTVMVFLALVLDRKEKEKASHETGKRVRIIRNSSWEPRACAVIGIALVAVAAGVFRKVYLGASPEAIRYPVVAACIVLFLMLLSYIRFRFEESVGKETGSPALVADAYHSKVDIYSLTLVLISLLSEYIQFRIDRWIAGLISLMILIIALKTLYNAFSVMLMRSNEAKPDERSVEDKAIMFTAGFVHFGKDRLLSRLITRFELDNPVKAGKIYRRIVQIGAVVLLAAWFASGFFIVNYNEQAIVERLGKPVAIERPIGPGLHFDWPRPIARVRSVDTNTVRWKRLGYVTEKRTDIILWTKAHYIKEYSMLTGDGAIVELAANLHYRVTDPGAFLYSAVDPESKLEMISYETLCRLVGQQPLFDVLAFGRDELEQLLNESIQSQVNRAGLGFEIVQICFLDVHPPMEVAPSFEEVVSAQEDLETYIEQAKGYYKETLPMATGEAFSSKIKAEGYQKEIVEKAIGQSEAFSAIAVAFKRYGSINRYQVRLDALDSWLAGQPLWLIDGQISERSLDLFLSQPGKNPLLNSGVIAGGDTGIEY
jgi:modulator of FtsH protease HflK